MSRRTTTRALAALSSVTLAFGVLTAISPAADAAATISTTHVFINKHRVTQLPGHLRPGAHKFVVTSKKSSAFQIVRADKGYSKADLAHDVNVGLNSDTPKMKAIKRFEKHVTLLGGVNSTPDQKGVMEVNLPRGTYWVADTNAKTTKVSQLVTVKVRGKKLPGTVSAGDATIQAIGDTSWSDDPAQIPAKGVLRFKNSSEDNHFIDMEKLAPGKTVEDFAAWVQSVQEGGQDAPPIDFSAPSLGTGVVSPGHKFDVKYDLTPGNYVLLCWWPDADMGGMPHVFMGMYRGITVGNPPE